MFSLKHEGDTGEQTVGVDIVNTSQTMKQSFEKELHVTVRYDLNSGLEIALCSQKFRNFYK